MTAAAATTGFRYAEHRSGHAAANAHAPAATVRRSYPWESANTTRRSPDRPRRRATTAATAAASFRTRTPATPAATAICGRQCTCRTERRIATRVAIAARAVSASRARRAARSTTSANRVCLRRAKVGVKIDSLDISTAPTARAAATHKPARAASAAATRTASAPHLHDM